MVTRIYLRPMDYGKSEPKPKTTITINERLRQYHARPYVFRSFGDMLSTALHLHWVDRYGMRDTFARMTYSTAKVD